MKPVNDSFDNLSYITRYLFLSKRSKYSYLVCIIVVPLYSVWCEYSLALYNTWRDGKDVFITGTDSPKITKLQKQVSLHSLYVQKENRFCLCL